MELTETRPLLHLYLSHNALKKSLEGANVPVEILLHKCIKAKPNSHQFLATATAASW